MLIPSYSRLRVIIPRWTGNVTSPEWNNLGQFSLCALLDQQCAELCVRLLSTQLTLRLEPVCAATDSLGQLAVQSQQCYLLQVWRSLCGAATLVSSCSPRDLWLQGKLCEH